MSRMMSVRIDEGLYDSLLQEAEKEGRSLSNYVIRLLTEAQRLREGHSTLGASPAKPTKKPSKRISSFG